MIPTLFWINNEYSLMKIETCCPLQIRLMSCFKYLNQEYFSSFRDIFIFMTNVTTQLEKSSQTEDFQRNRFFFVCDKYWMMARGKRQWPFVSIV